MRLSRVNSREHFVDVTLDGSDRQQLIVVLMKAAAAIPLRRG
jgi:hypothetical protein